MNPEWPQKRRPGLRNGMNSRDLNNIGLAERVMALALSGYAGQWRRCYDSPGVTRVPDWSAVRVNDWDGPCVSVRGYVDGVEDRGLMVAVAGVLGAGWAQGGPKVHGDHLAPVGGGAGSRPTTARRPVDAEKSPPLLEDQPAQRGMEGRRPARSGSGVGRNWANVTAAAAARMER